MDHQRNFHARRLFDGIANRYDLPAELFSFFQYGRWRGYLISRLNVGQGDRVMDLCTGTAGVAMAVVRAYDCKVVGVDVSSQMLRRAQSKSRRAGVDGNIELFVGRAEGLPFATDSFDAVCFTYLLRYVEDPEATLKEIVRVLKPGGRLVSLEFGLPENKIVRCLWYGYTRAVLPLIAGLISPGWRQVGAFLGPSISRFYRSYTVEQIQEMWIKLGIPEVKLKRLSLGGAVVMWGNKSVANAVPGASLARVGLENAGGLR